MLVRLLGAAGPPPFTRRGDKLKPLQMIAGGAALYAGCWLLTILCGRAVPTDIAGSIALVVITVGLARLYDLPKRPRRRRYRGQAPYSVNGPTL